MLALTSAAAPPGARGCVRMTSIRLVTGKLKAHRGGCRHSVFNTNDIRITKQRIQNVFLFQTNLSVRHLLTLIDITILNHMSMCINHMIFSLPNCV